jgi:DNA-binding transcriptional ArsR family regulator
MMFLQAGSLIPLKGFSHHYGQLLKLMKTTIGKNSDTIKLDTPALEDLALLYKAINHRLRQQILLFIHKNDKTNVKPIYRKLKLEQSKASHHLAILRNAGLVHTERQGQTICYSVNYQRLQKLHEAASCLL